MHRLERFSSSFILLLPRLLDENVIYIRVTTLIFDIQRMQISICKFQGDDRRVPPSFPIIFEDRNIELQDFLISRVQRLIS